MSGSVKAIVGTIVIPLALGGQFASSQRLDESARDAATTSQIAVNRVSKRDRAAHAAKAERPLQTVSIAFPDRARSILLRLRIAGESAGGSEAASPAETIDHKVGCEPVVSVLAEAFRRAQPGRCLT